MSAPTRPYLFYDTPRCPRSRFVLYKGRPHSAGVLFRCFLAAYLTWRLLIDFLKPQPLIAGMNLLQWACLVGLLILTATWKRSPLLVNRDASRNYA